LFDNPRVVATVMGTATVGMLFCGWATLRKTRHQMAGRALTLLACLIMPLNLWFYHAQDLHPLTLYEQLWVAALVCCALYAGSALVLRDANFVYVFVAGVVGTCLLIMADVQGRTSGRSRTRRSCWSPRAWSRCMSSASSRPGKKATSPARSSAWRSSGPAMSCWDLAC
jgi:hypothetical protein